MPTDRPGGGLAVAPWAGAVVVAALALLCLPWVAFVSSALPLYLNNQPTMRFRPEVVYPIVTLGLYAWIAALLALGPLALRHAGPGWRRRDADSGRLARAVLAFFYLLGPAFLVYLGLDLRALPEARAMLLSALALAVLGGLAMTVARRPARLVSLQQFVALMAVAMVLFDGHAWSKRLPVPVDGADGGAEAQLARASAQGSDEADRPNIYHLVLDEFQSEMFDVTLTGEVRAALGGFRYFPDTITLFGRTHMSLAAVFGGRRFDFEGSPAEYQRTAFNGPQSLLYWLKQAGYKTAATMFPVYTTFPLSGFDRVTLHSEGEFVSVASLTAAFRKLWLYGTFPEAVARRTIGDESVRQFKNQNFMGASAPADSYVSFERFLDQEPVRSERGRYEMIHLLIPHFPYVFRDDCSYASDGAQANPESQSSCATLMVRRLVDTLKRLDRFEDSLIIVQSDHGARFRREGDALVSVEVGANPYDTELWNTARARSVLMFKPPGNDGDGELEVSDVGAHLLDVAPTLLSLADVPAELELDGIDLYAPDAGRSDRTREYYFYDKAGTVGTVVLNVRRFVAGDDGLVRRPMR